MNNKQYREYWIKRKSNDWYSLSRLCEALDALDENWLDTLDDCEECKNYRFFDEYVRDMRNERVYFTQIPCVCMKEILEKEEHHEICQQKNDNSSQVLVGLHYDYGNVS